MKVVFRPSLEERVAFMAGMQRQQQSVASQSVSWIFFTFNLGVVPAFLLYKEMYIPALLVFGFNAAVAIFLLSWQQKRNIADYVRRTSPNLEDFDAEIDIGEGGIACEHAGNRTFYSWRNIQSVDQTDEVVSFNTGYAMMFVPKRALDLVNAEEFIAEAKRLKTAAEGAR